MLNQGVGLWNAFHASGQNNSVCSGAAGVVAVGAGVAVAGAVVGAGTTAAVVPSFAGAVVPAAAYAPEPVITINAIPHNPAFHTRCFISLSLSLLEQLDVIGRDNSTTSHTFDHYPGLTCIVTTL